MIHQNRCTQQYSLGYISSLFLRHRNAPVEALHHLNKAEDKPLITSMVPLENHKSLDEETLSSVSHLTQQ